VKRHTRLPSLRSLADRRANRGSYERIKIAEAARHYHGGEYQLSLESLDAAARIFPSPRLEFNRGVVLRKLGRLAEALEAFERFVDATEGATDAEIAARRTEASRSLPQLGQQVATIEVAGDGAGSEVFVDGRSLGTMPLGRPARVMPGEHLIVLREARAGAPVFTHHLQVSAGQKVIVRVSLPLAAPAALPGEVALAPGAGRAPTPPQAERPRHRRWWLWAAVGAVAVGAAAGALVLTSQRKESACRDRECVTVIPVP
jgi:hypothetical protein